jgi:protein involved in temperature-dependent protein secretion
MLEVYVDNTVVYFPFETIKRVEIPQPSSFIELYTPRCKILDRKGNTTHGFLPTLYAGSTTHPDQTIRTGRMTTFAYVGRACRGTGQRDLKIDGGTMMGIERVAMIEFS